MKVTVTTLEDSIFYLDVSEDLELENFKAFCEIETGITASEIMILYEGRPLLDDKKTLKVLGLKEGDVVLLQQMHVSHSTNPQQSSGGLPNIDFGSIAVPNSFTPMQTHSHNSPSEPGSSRGRGEENPAFIRDMFMANPDQLSMLKQNNPRLAEALLSGKLETFASVLEEQQKEKLERERMKIRLMNAAPFDIEAQRLIADEIRLKNIESNMEAAMEYNPESFGQVVMLYINCKVNGHPVKAFIDSGAQTTIMSQACAERCNIKRLVDTRWAGVAKGVGMQKIIGRVHLGQIQIQDVFLTSSFSILEDQPMDMLLGLDMLRRHQCCIDLKRNVLVIGTTGTETVFLNESELPECVRQLENLEDMESSLSEDDDKQLAEALNRSAQDISESSGSSSDTFSETSIQQLVGMGFARDKVIAELRRFNGDVNQAMAALFAKSLKF